MLLENACTFPFKRVCQELKLCREIFSLAWIGGSSTYTNSFWFAALTCTHRRNPWKGVGETSWSEDIKCFEAFHGKQSSIPLILSVAKVDCLIRQRTSTCEMEKLSHPCRPAQTVGGKRGQEELDKTRDSKSPRVSWPVRNTSELLDQTTNQIQTRKTRSIRLYYVIINHCFLSILSCKQLQLNIPNRYIS